MVNALIGKKILVIAAHQDDESLYFGGLLASCAESGRIKILSITKPDSDRKDFRHRMGAFVSVADMLGARYSIYDIKNFKSDSPFEIACAPQIREGVAMVKNEILGFKPDVIFTHGAHGDPTPVYLSGHIMHKFCNEIVLEAVQGGALLPIFTSAVSIGAGEIRVQYDVAKKKKLISQYAPAWEPIRKGYSFCYKPEFFNREKPNN